MQLPRCIGKYELIERLGGVVAEVYRARDLHLGRAVAFKILSDSGLADPEAKARFLAEARLSGSLVHENVTAFYDYGELDGHPYLVMEYLAGESLQTLIHEGRAGDLSAKLALARQIAGALAYVHSKGIVHRDVKPNNIRVDALGVVKLMDFGIAKTDDFSVTAPGFTVGTPYYMAPEQIRGEKPTHLVDIYAFGMLLYELLTGIRPFEAQSVDEIFDMILHKPVELDPLATVRAPSGLVSLIAEMTEKDPALRPRNCSVVMRRLDLISA